jgi:steroid delta-isomerase-like uncharacterized protein
MGDAAKVGRRSFDAFNAHDEAGIREHYADDVVMQAPGSMRLEGADAATEYAATWLRAFPDAKVELESEIASGDQVVYEFTFEGTHENTLAGPAGEIPATGRRVTGKGVQIFRVQDGKIVEDHLYFDQVEVLTQLGLMPEPAAATSP